MTDTHSEIEEFVEEWRTKYQQKVASDDTETLEDLIASAKTKSRWVALGMVYLGDVEEAQRWFATVGPAFVDSSRRILNRINDPETTAAGPRPWSNLYKGIQMAVLSRVDDVLAETVDGAHSLVTDPVVDQFPDSELPYIGLVRALTALLGENDVTTAALEDFRKRITASDSPDDEEFFSPQAPAIEGLDQEDPALVGEGIEDILEWHDQRLSAYDGEYEIVEKGVEVKSCTFLVLARQRGLDVRVDSEYVPEAVYELA